MEKINKKADCLFCSFGKERYILENEYAYVIEDKYPVTRGHSLVIPKRHVSEYFDLTEEENTGIFRLLNLRKDQLLNEDDQIDGFNVGMNVGHTAGQTVFHVHVHLIPRRHGDIEDPTGGVRGVIPEKRVYVRNE